MYHETNVSINSDTLLTIKKNKQLTSLPKSEPNYSVNSSETEFDLNSKVIRRFSRALSLEASLSSTLCNNQNENCNSSDDTAQQQNAQGLDGLVLSHISHREAKISVFAGMVRIYKAQPKRSGGGVRGAVGEFTRAARKRMLERLAVTRNMGKSSFVTLTYPARYPDNAETWKRHLDTFFKRLKRVASDCHAVWRIEPQERGAPHFHLIVCNHPSTHLRFRMWVKLAWYQVVGSGDEKHLRAGTRADRIMNRQHAIAYAAKYAAKPSDGGRRFVTNDGEIIEHVGKHWGIFNAGAADTSSFGEFTLSPLEVIELRRMMARFLKSKGSRYAKRLARGQHNVGWSVFGLGDDAQTDGKRLTVMRMLLAVADV